MPERLEAADRSPKLFAFLDIGDRVLERPLGDAKKLRGDDQPLVVETGHQLHPRVVLPAEQAILRHMAVGEEDVVDLAPAHRLDRSNVDALDIGGHREHGEALVLVLPPVRAAHEQDVVGLVCTGDPCLLAVDHVVPVAPLGLAGEAADVGARIGLGHRDRFDGAGDDTAEHLLLLLFGAEALICAGRDHAHGVEAHRDQPARELLAQQAHVEGPAARASVFLGDRGTEPAELGDPLVEILVVGIVSVVRECVALLAGAALALRKVADRLHERALLVAEGLTDHGVSWWWSSTTLDLSVGSMPTSLPGCAVRPTGLPE